MWRSATFRQLSKNSGSRNGFFRRSDLRSFKNPASLMADDLQMLATRTNLYYILLKYIIH
jgi:hypothetical protein